MSKSIASALVLSGLLCWSGSQAMGQTPLNERADRKANGTENAQEFGPTNRDQGQPGQPGRPDQQRTTVQRPVQQQSNMPAHAHAGYTQHDLAALLTICNEGEVALSKIGAQKAKHDDVKKFADEMVKVHTDMIAKVQQADAAGIAAAGQPGGQAQPNQQANRNDNATVGRRSASVDAAESGFVALHREIAAQCRQSKEEELSKKDGAEFDKCFMGAQLGAHMAAIDSMKVFQRHTSGELRQTIDEGIKTAESHLEHAKKIMKDLEDDSKSDSK